MLHLMGGNMYNIKEGCPRYIMIDQYFWVRTNDEWCIVQVDQNFEFKTTTESIVKSNKITHYIFLLSPIDPEAPIDLTNR